jgi:hypothetical protein
VLQLDSWSAFLEVQEKDFAEENGQSIDPDAKKTMFFLMDFIQSILNPLLLPSSFFIFIFSFYRFSELTFVC